MKKKVLFLIESLSGGGAEKVLTTLVQNINKDKFDVTVCSIVNAGVYKDEIKSCVNYCYLLDSEKCKSSSLLHRLSYLLKYKLIYNWLPAKWVYKLFIPKGFDVEVAFIEGFATKIMSASTNKQAKKYAWVHTDLKNNHWIGNIYKSLSEEKESYSKYDLIVGVSNTVSNAVKQLYGLNNVKTLYNPISSDSIIKASALPTTIPMKSNGTLRLISIGRFVSQKGYDRLIEIANTLHIDGIDFELWLLGDGPDKEIYQKYIQENNLRDVVHIPGFLSNPYSVMKNCDLFICSSRSEGYSTVVTEALILGIPVITTDCSGMDELLDNGKYGMIVANNYHALEDGIRKLITDNQLLELYKNKAQVRRCHFSINELMKPIEYLLNE